MQSIAIVKLGFAWAASESSSFTYLLTSIPPDLQLIQVHISICMNVQLTKTKRNHLCMIPF
jgi:hypothetical protein